jgi:hypothetical protein
MKRINVNLYIFIIFVLSEIAYIYASINSGRHNIPVYMYVYYETFILFFFGVCLIRRYKAAGKSIAWLNKLLKLPAGTPNRLLLFILSAGIIFRLTLFASDITTSDDVYRYVWEGKVITNGFNPYKNAPNAECYNKLHTKDYPQKVSFPDMPAIYPPYSQLIFAASYKLAGESFWGLKLIYLISEIGTMFFLLKLLKLRNKNPLNIIYYAWLPLPVLEFFGNVHLDPIGITFIVMFIYLIEKDRYYLGSAALAISFLAKLYPLFLFPLLLKKLNIRQLILSGLIFTAVCIVFYLPFIDRELSVLKFLSNYLTNWQFNGSVFSLFKEIFNSRISRYICTGGLVISIIAISYYYKNFFNAVYGIFLAIVIFATTLYPWYLGWLSALNVINPFYSILSLAFTINLSNLTPLSPHWTEYAAVKLIEYIPFFSFLIYDFRRIALSSKVTETEDKQNF